MNKNNIIIVVISFVILTLLIFFQPKASKIENEVLNEAEDVVDEVLVEEQIQLEEDVTYKTDNIEPVKKQNKPVSSGSINPNEDKPELEVNEHGRVLVSEESPGKKSLKAEEEFNDIEEKPEDYDNIPQPDEDLEWQDY